MDSVTPVGRFAPTPSGRMHLGNVFAALIAWLSVKSQGGEMVLRMEDLDTQRTSEEYVRVLREDLTWLGLTWDRETPPQSRQTRVYDAYFEQLRDKGLLYPCYCTRSQLHSVNAPHLSDGTYVLARIRIRNRADIICGKVVEEHTHKFGAWVVTKEPTATEPGLKERVCACGEKEVVEIPALGKDPQTGDSSNLTLWIVIMAVAIVGAAVALFFLLKKRKSNKD